MESFFGRYRNLIVLLLVLAAQMIGLAVQVRRTAIGRNSFDAQDGPGVRLIRLWAEGLVSPAERVIHGTKTGTFQLWQDYVDLRHVREQNQDLQKTIDRLRLEQASLLEDARQGQRLQGLLDFQQKYVYKTVAAQAIGTSGSDQSRVLYLDKGKDYGLEPDMAVITGDGIVGKVREVFPHTAQVLLINDQTSGAGVILETTRTRGILRGNAAGQPQIVGILADQRIQPGERVLTAGGDQIFPRGLAVGVVEKVVRDPDRDSFIDIIVKPAAHLDRLDEVVVITSTQPRFSTEQQQDLATSEALKGPEVEQAKAQKKAAEIMAERLPALTDPNLPADQQPLHDNSLPTSVGHVPQALHPDRFTPGSAPTPDLSAEKEKEAVEPATPAKPQAKKPGSANPAGQGQPAKKAPPTNPGTAQTKAPQKASDPARRNP
jgi:rod shape-determining protein MreC